MIIESIEIENFMCYSGHNEFKFSEGLNVIIGDNGYGKSKLYDAFYWAMYDQCFDTSEKEWKKTSYIRKAIISDKAIHEADEGMVRASVRLMFRDSNRDIQYIIQRTLRAVKNEDSLVVDKDSEETLTFVRIAGMSGKVVTDAAEVQRIKTKILPSNVRPYMWFQGEQVESIIDFGASDSLTQAINVLSNISRFDRVQEVAQSLKDHARRQYNREAKALSSDLNKSEQLQRDREKSEERIQNLVQSIEQASEQLAIAEDEKSKLISRQDDAQKIRDLDGRRKNLEEQLRRISEDEIQEKSHLNQKILTRKWVLKGTEHPWKLYQEKFKDYQYKKLRKIEEAQIKADVENKLKRELQTRLPLNVPEPIHVEKMLEDEKCLVCDRKAPKDSEAWLKIKQLLDRTLAPSVDVVEEVKSLHNFESVFKHLSHVGMSGEVSIAQIDGDINEAFEQIRRLSMQRKSVYKDLEKIQGEVLRLSTDSSLNADDAKGIINKLEGIHSHEKRFAVNLSNDKRSLENIRKELARIDKELGDLVRGELPFWLEERNRLLTDFKEIADSTRDRVFKNLLDLLENEANKHYQKMMQGNQSAQGIIKLVESSKGNYMPSLVDEQGKELQQLNTGNIILIKLATIMAIISARKGSRATDLYTLITDAPMSVFGEDYTIGFCKTVSSIYRQSIIMSKEFYKNTALRKQLMNDQEINLGRVYMISPSIPEKDRTNRNKLSTTIQALN